MNRPILRLVAALFAIMFVVTACAGDSVQWTFAPVAVSDTSASEESSDASPTDPTDPTVVSVTDVQTGDAVPQVLPDGAGDTNADVRPVTAGVPGTPDTPRVIELQLTAALQITDTAGTKVEDILVAPGETVTFVVDNIAGFDHNFYIGTEDELTAPSATTDVGIPTWSTGVQQLTWTVPDDVAGLQFGCTVTGHYTLMHGTFSVADGSAEPQPPAEPTGSVAPSESAAPGTGSVGTPDAPRVIELQLTGALQFTDTAGTKVEDIPVTPGETITFVLDNVAGFDHNFYIGTEGELSAPSATTDVGVPTWSTGVQELTWTVPDDVAGLQFGCTVPGHYTLMHGTFSVADGSAEPQPPGEPAATMPPMESMAPSESAAPATGSAGTADKRVVNLEATAALQFTQDGVQIQDIPVTPGETVVIRVDNTAGFAHNLYIGTDAELSSPNATTAVGIPDWNTGVQFVEWEVPADITGLKFGCTVPGHYTLMQGTFSVSP